MSFQRVVIMVAVFLGFNLLGPSGILHWLNLKNEKSRIEKQILSLNQRIEHDKNELDRFHGSETVQKRAVRNELGYLLENEISVEFSK